MPFRGEELRHIADVIELLNSQQESDYAFAGGQLDHYWADTKQGSVSFFDDTWWFEPEPPMCISCGELDEYREKHCRQQEEIYRLKALLREAVVLLDPMRNETSNVSRKIRLAIKDHASNDDATFNEL